MHKNFQYYKLSETQEGSATKYFGTIRQKSFAQLLGTTNFQKHKNAPPPSRSFLADKKFRRLLVTTLWFTKIFAADK